MSTISIGINRGHIRGLYKYCYTNLHSEWRLIGVASLMGCVCALIFTADILLKPYANVLFSFAVVGLVAAFALQKRFSAALLPIVSLLIGLFVSAIRLYEIPAPLELREHYTTLTGVVEEVDFRDDGPNRLVITLYEVQEPLHKGDTIRLSVRTKMPHTLRPGDTIETAAILSRSNGALVPKGYDFARSARHKGIVADGYSVTTIYIISSNNKTIFYKVNQLRKDIEDRVMAALPNQSGAVAAALLVGYRGHLSEETKENLKRAGLSHLLAISGLHMGLVTGCLFFLFELIFAFIPMLALRFMPRKLAVWPAWIGGFGYLFLSGASVSTMRAFIMVSVAMVAILADRRVLSLRSVALAAIIVMCLRPEAVLTIGFQMSFAATAGLVAFYERWTRYRRKQGYSGLSKTGSYKFLEFIGGIALTSLIAQLAVALFALYHFQELSVIALVGNILVLPIVTFFVMPLLLLGVLLPWDIISLGLGPLLALILTIADTLAHLDYATVIILPLHGWVLTVGTVVLLLVLLIPTRLITAVGVLLLVTFFVAGQKTPADLLVSETGKSFMVRSEQGFKYWGVRAGSFRDRLWRSYMGVNSNSAAVRLKRMCDVTACHYPETSLTYTRTLEGVYDACSAGDIVILPRKYKRYCKGAAAILTHEQLASHGPTALYFKPSVRVEWSNR